ncbi:TPA: hypothetical protein R1740_001674, partial [Campylobacter lari]|nr:hypothetical protein [Campylobacter lari]
KVGVCLGFNSWKREWFAQFIPDYNLKYIKKNYKSCIVLLLLIRLRGNYEVFIWGCKYSFIIEKYLRFRKITFYRVEDAFVRSIGLGADKIPPLSVVIDKNGIYFDPNSHSELFDLIKFYSKNITEKEKQRARNNIDF